VSLENQAALGPWSSLFSCQRLLRPEGTENVILNLSHWSFRSHRILTARCVCWGHCARNQRCGHESLWRIRDKPIQQPVWLQVWIGEIPQCSHSRACSFPARAYRNWHAFANQSRAAKPVPVWIFRDFVGIPEYRDNR